MPSLLARTPGICMDAISQAPSFSHLAADAANRFLSCSSCTRQRAALRRRSEIESSAHDTFSSERNNLLHYGSPSPGTNTLLSANIFPLSFATNPSTCLANCSTCRLFTKPSSLPGSCGNLNSRCHSSSGRGVCLAEIRAAFSALRFASQVAILACSRASERWW